MFKSLAVLFSMLFVSAAVADVQLRVEDARSGVSTISSNGRVARIDDADRPQYVIVDLRRGEAKMVDPVRATVVVSRFDKSADVASAPLTLRLDDQGGGPRIAGYGTRKLALLADGERCGTVYASASLAKDPGVRAMFDAMRGMQRMAQGMSAQFGGLLGTCQRASLQLSSAIQGHGVPMRVLDEQGRMVSEILEVDTARRIDASHYLVPAGMARVDMDQQLDQAMRQGGQMMNDLPDINEMMRQMQQQGGKMNAEMQRQMEKMQEMLQQMEPGQ